MTVSDWASKQDPQNGPEGRGATAESAAKREAAEKRKAVRVAQLQKQILNKQLFQEEELRYTRLA